MTAQHQDQRMRGHDGAPAPSDADYLEPKDPAIGVLVSAETNRRHGGWYPVDGALRRTRIEIALLALILGGVLGAVLVHASGPMDLVPWTDGLDLTHKLVAYGIAVAAAIVAVLASLPFRRRRASYVGLLGLQRHVVGLFGGARTDVLRFSDCAKLRVLVTRHLLNGTYTHTAYRYAWYDARDACVFVIDGRYDDRVPPRFADPVRFALAAEKAWQRRTSGGQQP